MFASLPVFIRVPSAILLIVANTLVHVLLLFALTLAKLVLPIPAVRQVLSRALAGIAESWIAVNSALFGLFTRIRWHVEIPEGLRRNGNYLVLCNHRSWVDIPVLQKIFNRRVPLLRFFLKSQLIWVPLLGPAWWALDFPFMKRYSRQTLEKHPELKGKDREATRLACEKFRTIPVSVMNFVEGTRFTPAKQAAQPSPYRYLLQPRAGGIAFVLDAMAGSLESILDVTIVYPDGPVSMMDLVASRISDIHVYVRQRPIGDDLRGDYENDAAFRLHFQTWVNALWAEKDALIGKIKEAG